MSTRIVRVVRRLASALADLVEAIPGPPHTPTRLAAELGVNKDLSHRVVIALRQKDPVAVAHLIPGPTPLRRFVEAGARRGVPPGLASEAKEAIRDFDQLIRQEAGDRSDFDAIISAWLPEARARFEGVAKQSLYRGARHIKGIAANMVFYTVFLHPPEDKERLDSVHLRGYLGIRCVRPGAVLKLSVQSGASHPAAVPMTLSGQPIDGAGGVFLREFCAGPSVETEIYRNDQDVVYGLRWGDAVGLNSARDIVLGELRRAGPRAYREANDPRPKVGLTNTINVPSRSYICDLLLHKDVYPDWEPQVRILETGELGTADPNDASRDLDVLDVLERIEPLGRGVERFRAAEIPNYIELLKYVCGKTGWNPNGFRGYRTRIDYPIFGSQVQFAFDLPLRLSQAAQRS